jgi:hypothetical protein
MEIECTQGISGRKKAKIVAYAYELKDIVPIFPSSWAGNTNLQAFSFHTARRPPRVFACKTIDFSGLYDDFEEKLKLAADRTGRSFLLIFEQKILKIRVSWLSRTRVCYAQSNQARWFPRCRSDRV